MNPGAEIKSSYNIKDDSLYVKLSNDTIGSEISSGTIQYELPQKKLAYLNCSLIEKHKFRNIILT